MRLKLKRSSSTRDFGPPVPRAYSITIKINSSWTFMQSKYENAHSVEFSKDKSKRFNYNYDKTPWTI